MFRFDVRYIELKHLNSLQIYDIKAVLSTLQFLLDHKWNIITTSKTKKYHTVPVLQCAKSISNHHKQCQEKEIGYCSDNIISFAYKDKGRLLGFRESNVFFITYIDVDHKYVKG